MTLRTSLTIGGDASGAKAALKETEASLKKVKQGADDAAGALGKAEKATSGAKGGLDQTTQATDALGKSQKVAAGHVTNLMFQFQDIGMMLAAGQNPLMLAMQQGTQVSGVFRQMEGTGTSAFSAIKGGLLAMVSPMSLLTLGVIAGGAALVQWGVSSVGAADDAQSLAEEIDGLTGSVSDYIKLVEEAAPKFGDAFGNARQQILLTSEAQRDLIALAKIDAYENLRRSLEGLNDAATHYSRLVGEIGDAGDLLGVETQLRGHIGIWHENRDAVREFIGALDDMSNAVTLEDQYAAAIKVRDAFKESVDVTGQMDDRQKDFWRSLSQSILQMELLGAGAREADKALASQADQTARLASAYYLYAKTRQMSDATVVAESQKVVTAYQYQAALSQSIIAYGKDSAQVAVMRRDLEMQSVDALIAQNGWSGSVADNVRQSAMAAYDAEVALANAEVSTRAAADAARDLASAIAAAAGFSANLDNGVRVLEAQVNALTAGANAANAATVERLRINAEAQRSAQIAAGQLSVIANAQYAIDMAQIDRQEQLLAQKGQLEVANRSAGRSARSAASDVKRLNDQLQKQAKTLNEAADPMLAYANGLKELQELQKAGLSEAAYSNELQKLNDELASSVPLVNDVADAWGDFVARGFKDFEGFKDAVLGSFRSLIAQMVSTAARNSIMIGLGLAPSSRAGGGGSAGGSAASSLLSNALGIKSSAAGGGGLLSSALGTLGGGGLSGFAGALGSGSGLAGAFSGLAGGAGLMGGLGSTLAATFGTGGGIGGLLSIGGNAALAGGGLMASVGAALPVVGIALAAFSFFKTKTKELDTGLRLTATGADIAAESFRKIEKTKFWGLSKKVSTEFTAIDNEPFQQAYDQIYGSITDMAGQLNIGAEAFDGFSHQFSLSLKGLDDAAREAAIAEAMTGLSDSLAEAALGSGATAAELQAMVLGLNTANAAFDKLGLNIYESSVAGARAAENMLLHFESLEAFTASAVYYFENFYSDAERLDAATSDLSTILEELGFSTIPQTRAQFRMLVDGMREAGLDDAVAALLQVAPLFAEIEAAWSNNLDTMLSDAETALAEAERAAQGAYAAAVRSIEAQKAAVLDEWKDLLQAAEEATRTAAAKVQTDTALIARVFGTASTALSELIDVASGRVDESNAIFDKLASALSGRSRTGETALQERTRAVVTIESGDRAGLDDALNTLSRDAAALYADQASYLRSYARETNAIENMLAETQAQLSIEEQTLSALESQADGLAAIRSQIDEQVAIANGQLATLEDAVAAIYGTGSVNLAAILELVAAAKLGDTVSQDRLSSVVAGIDLTAGVLDFVNAGIAALADAKTAEDITRAAAEAQIASANDAAANQLAALNESVSGILGLDSGILGVNEALSALDESIFNLSAAQLQMSQAEQKQAELLLQQSAAQTKLMAQLLEAQRVGQIGDLQVKLEEAVSSLGAAPEVLKIIEAVGRGSGGFLGLSDRSSYVTLSNGQQFHSKSGSTANEVATATKMAEVAIAASEAAFADWKKQYDEMVQPLRNQIVSMGGVPSFNGGGWTGDGTRAGGVDGLGGFYSILHPQEYVFDTTKMSPPKRGSAGSTDADLSVVVRELAGIRNEMASLRQESRQQQGKIVLNTTRLAQKARDDERNGALVRSSESVTA